MKKKKTAQKPKKSLLRIALPVILAAVILWAGAMCQITKVTSARMIDQIPEGLEGLSEKATLIVWNTPNYVHKDPTTLPDTELVQGLGEFLYPFWWGFYDTFPAYTCPFLLDPSGFDWLPPELRYGYQLGMGLFTEDGVPLFTTCNLMQIDFSDYEYKDTMVLRDDPLTVDGVAYQSIGKYLESRIYPHTFEDMERGSVYRDWGPNYYGLGMDVISLTSYGAMYQDCVNTFSDIKLGFAAVVLCKPLAYCALRLIPFYVVSGLFVALLVGSYLGWIRRRLLLPVQEVITALEQEAYLLDAMDSGKVMPEEAKRFMKITRIKDWSEPAFLKAYLPLVRQTLAKDQAEITRLTTALDYAKDAEEYRKRLISDITHELKTPLAVIHSYAEGLQSEIAPEKKEQYVQVILDEAERMDGMVLQMLDLSRLESGQVKLHVESFSLRELTEYVAEKFQPLLAEKNLTLGLEIEGKVQMNGDEARMEQVITNFMSNAVKYSPVGGEIRIRAFSGMKDVYFTITNTANHLSEEGLNKVFDSFYREDAARTEKSTGLGLAIVKQILSLHSGQCYVNNTALNDKPAVEFGFDLPL